MYSEIFRIYLFIVTAFWLTLSTNHYFKILKLLGCIQQPCAPHFILNTFVLCRNLVFAIVKSQAHNLILLPFYISLLYSNLLFLLHYIYYLYSQVLLYHWLVCSIIIRSFHNIFGCWHIETSNDSFIMLEVLNIYLWN